jgi:transaldolase
MKIFLDTADRRAIEKWAQTGIINGVTTNPTHLSKEGGSPERVVKDICQLLPAGDISVEITEKEPEAVYQQAKAIAALAKNITVKVPCHLDYYEVIKRLVQDKININVTLVFTVVQSLFMCKLSVKYISPFVGRWDDIGISGSDILFDIRHMIDQYNFNTQLLAASLRHPEHVYKAIMAGADVATMPIDVLEKITRHPLTNQGMELFLADWKKLNIDTFP